MSADTKRPIASQPQATVPMATGGNRNALNCKIELDGKRDWSVDLLDCTHECGLCCWATWCPCVVSSKNKQRLDHLQNSGTPLPSEGERYNGDCYVYGCLTLTGYAWILQIGNRATIRSRYNIRGDAVEDCLVSMCCQPCALTQERREIELEENSFEGFSRVNATSST